MDFIADNYIWAIIIVIVVLMAIVGYIADKTDFGRKEFAKRVTPDKPKKEKTKKEKAKKAKKSEVVEELPVVSDESLNNEVLDNVTEQEPSSNDLSFDSIVSDDLVQNQSVDVPGLEEDIQLENVNSFDLNNDSTMDFNNGSEENEAIDQSLFEPLPSIDQVFSTPVGEEVSDSENSGESLSEAVNQESEVESDDDIWKF